MELHWKHNGNKSLKHRLFFCEEIRTDRLSGQRRYLVIHSFIHFTKPVSHGPLFATGTNKAASSPRDPRLMQWFSTRGGVAGRGILSPSQCLSTLLPVTTGVTLLTPEGEVRETRSVSSHSKESRASDANDARVEKWVNSELLGQMGSLLLVRLQDS